MDRVLAGSRSVPARWAATAGFAAVEPVGTWASAADAKKESVQGLPVAAYANRLASTQTARVSTSGLRDDVGTIPFPESVPAQVGVGGHDTIRLRRVKEGEKPRPRTSPDLPACSSAMGDRCTHRTTPGSRAGTPRMASRRDSFRASAPPITIGPRENSFNSTAASSFGARSGAEAWRAV